MMCHSSEELEKNHLLTYLTIAPKLAPTNTTPLANATPGPNPMSVPKTKPLPNVNIDPGTNNTVAAK